MDTLCDRLVRWGLPLLLALLAGMHWAESAAGAEAQWVWYPERDPASVPVATRYFRTTFRLSRPASGQIEITCDDTYDLFVNGERVGGDDEVTTLERFNILPNLVAGPNVVAVRAKNTQAGSTAGLMVRLNVKDAGGTMVSHSTDGTWRTNTYGPRGWNTSAYDDSRWLNVRALGEFGKTLPWKGKVLAPDGGTPDRFVTPPGFRVEQVVPPQQTGSVAAIAFNERNELLVARENGPLLIVQRDAAGQLKQTVNLYADQVTGIQGILPLNGMVFCVGKGPEGTALCRLSDEDVDGQIDQCKTLLKFHGPMMEHGPHAPVLGPEGLIYLAVGNHTRALPSPRPTSPYHHFYEGDLIQPRYEDPGGHANGLKAPGATVIRTDIEGSFVELVCGGLRNHYDLAFNAEGELFTADSDMEWDYGLPWYRPARVVHCVPGGEYGWRSGWAKWPDYYRDSLPAAADLGRGSPAGLTFYDHHRFPAQYRGSLLVCDWSQGRIMAVYPTSTAGTYEASADVLVQGRPLNATDIAVGPDGWVYFSTGGRGTEGGIYRVIYDKPPPEPARQAGIREALQQPQITSAWGRDRIARIRLDMQEAWARDMVAYINDPANDAELRARGLDLLQLVGPFPSHKFLVKLAADEQPLIRRKAAYLMGIHANGETAAALFTLLGDDDPTVARLACESLIRARQAPPTEKLLTLFSKAPRSVKFAALRLLQAISPDRWRAEVLTTDEASVFVWGSLALLPLTPEDATLDTIIARSRHFLRGYLSDEDFLTLLRVLQLTLIQGPPGEAAVASLAVELAEEYPAQDARMNRELIRLLVHLQEESVIDRYFQQLVNDEVPLEERLHLAMHLQFLHAQLPVDHKTSLLAFYEASRTLDGGASLARYLDNAAKDFLTTLTAAQRGHILANGDRLPGMALQILRSCPRELSDEQVQALIDLDTRIARRTDQPSRELATGLMAVLGTSGNEAGLNYVRSVFDRDPERRTDVAMVLASRPTEDMEENKQNWPLLIRSLPVIDGVAAEMVLTSLGQIRLKPLKSEPTRQVILAGLRLGNPGGEAALGVLELWHRKQLAGPDDKPTEGLARWQDWFGQQWPDSPPATLPEDDPEGRWSYDDLLAYLESDVGYQGDPERGRELFAGKGQCIKCHRHGSDGETIGPDLSAVGSRFSRREILQSILFPNQTISDQYQSKTVLTTAGKTYTGLVGSGGLDSIVVLLPSGQKVEIPNEEIDEMSISPQSAMPSGLLDSFTEEEVADLFRFLTRPAPSGG